jgi:hypothetical protein
MHFSSDQLWHTSCKNNSRVHIFWVSTSYESIL